MSDLQKVKELRRATGAGFKDCNNALKEANGDVEKSLEILRIKGRCWIEGKALPLQIQMVGSRFNSWFEIANEDSWKPSKAGIDLVSLSLRGGVKNAFNARFI